MVVPFHSCQVAHQYPPRRPLRLRLLRLLRRWRPWGFILLMLIVVLIVVLLLAYLFCQPEPKKRAIKPVKKKEVPPPPAAPLVQTHNPLMQMVAVQHTVAQPLAMHMVAPQATFPAHAVAQPMHAVAQ